MELRAEKVIKLISKLSNLVEDFDDVFSNKKYNLTIKDKFLIFVMDENKKPAMLIKELGVAKTNLAIISKELLKEGLIFKTSDEKDRRSIVYSISEKGKLKVAEILGKLNKNITNQLSTKTNFENINYLIDNLLLAL